MDYFQCASITKKLFLIHFMSRFLIHFMSWYQLFDILVFKINTCIQNKFFQFVSFFKCQYVKI